MPSRAPVWAARLLLWFAAYAQLLVSLAPGLSLEDSGELATCAWTLSNSHHPGYQLHAMLGRLAMVLPAGCPAFRTSLLSALCGSLAAVALFDTVRIVGRAAGRSGVESLIAGLAGALALCFSRTFWWQSAITEKYAMNLAFFAAGVLAITARWAAGKRGPGVDASLAAGLALAHHLLAVFLAPLLAAVTVTGRSARRLLVCGLVFLIPLSVKAIYPPVRSVAAPPVNWETPSKAPALYRYLTVERYRNRFFGPTQLKGLVTRAAGHVRSVPARQLGPVLVLSMLGLVFLVLRARWAAYGAGLVLATSLLLVPSYRVPEVEQNYLPAIWILAGLSGIGAMAIWNAWRPALVAAVLCLAAEAWLSHPYGRQSANYADHDHAMNMLSVVRDRDFVIGWGDQGLTPLLYEIHVEKRSRASLLSYECMYYGDPDRSLLYAELGAGASAIRWFQEGPAMLWAVARALGPRRRLFVTLELPPQQSPSRGFEWNGLLLRISSPGHPAGAAPGSDGIVRRSRFRSLRAPMSFQEHKLRWLYTYALADQARALIDGRRIAEAAAAIRTGLYIDPASPDLLRLGAEWTDLTGRRARAAMVRNRGIELSRGHDLVALVEAARALGSTGGRVEEAAAWRRAALEAAGGDQAALRAALEKPGSRTSGEAEGYRRVAGAGLVGLAMDQIVGSMIHPEWKGFRFGGDLRRGSELLDLSVAACGAGAAAFQNTMTVAVLEERFADALSTWRAASALGMTNAEMTEMAADVRAALDAFGREKACRAKAEENPTVGNLCDLGAVYWKVGRFRVAEDLFRRALVADPRSPRALGNLGATLLKEGRVAEAIVAYERQVAAAPGDAGAAANLDQLRKVAAPGAAGRPERP